MSGHTVISRRDLLTSAAAGAGLAAYGDISRLAEAAPAKQGTVTLADIGVGDPGTWAPFTTPTGWSVRLVSIGRRTATVGCSAYHERPVVSS